MKMRALAALIAALAALPACTGVAGAVLRPEPSTSPARLAPGNYTLDKAHAALTFRIDHLGFSDFIGRWEAFDASLDIDPANPSAARVNAIIDMTSLDIANDAFAAELMGPNWFDAAAHPQAVFTSSAVSLTSPSTADVTGDLTLKGITRPVVVSVKFNGGDYDRLRGRDILGFSATARLNRSDFGMDRFSGLLTDDVRLEIEAEFMRRPPG